MNSEPRLHGETLPKSCNIESTSPVSGMKCWSMSVPNSWTFLCLPALAVTCCSSCYLLQPFPSSPPQPCLQSSAQAGPWASPLLLTDPTENAGVCFMVLSTQNPHSRGCVILFCVAGLALACTAHASMAVLRTGLTVSQSRRCLCPQPVKAEEEKQEIAVDPQWHFCLLLFTRLVPTLSLR